MEIKKIAGYIFVTISVILLALLIFQIQNLFIVLLGLVKVLQGSISSYESGKVFGALLFYIINGIIIYCLWHWGNKWINKQPR